MFLPKIFRPKQDSGFGAEIANCQLDDCRDATLKRDRAKASHLLAKPPVVKGLEVLSPILV
jgi:hypothetical protein